MAVFAAVREREARRIGEAAGRSVHDFGNQRERLQRARAEIFEQQQRGKIAELALVGDGQHRAQPFQVDVSRAHVVMRRHHQLRAPRARVFSGGSSRDGEQCVAGAGAARRIHQIHDRRPDGSPTMAVCGSETKSRTAAECQ